MSKLTIVLLVILVVLIVAFIALYFLGKRAQKKKEEDENKDYITKLEVNDNTVVDLFNKMNNVAGHYCGVSEYYTDSKVTAASLGNEFVYELAVLNVEKMYGKVDITEAQFDNVVSSILGSNYKYNRL